MKRKRAKIGGNAEKYYRWFRRYWYYAYLKRVKMTEQEIGGVLWPC